MRLALRRILCHTAGMRYLLLMLPLLLASCEFGRKPTASPTPYVALPVPAQSPSAKPVLDSARDTHQRMSTAEAAVMVNHGKATAGASELSVQLRETTKEVDRLRKQKSASESELVLLYNRLEGQDRKMGTIISDLQGTSTALNEERALRQKLQTELDSIDRLIITKENENGVLRELLAAADASAKSFATANTDLKAQIEKLTARLSAAESRAAVWLKISAGSCALLLLILGWHIIRFALTISTRLHI